MLGVVVLIIAIQLLAAFILGTEHIAPNVNTSSGLKVYLDIGMDVHQNRSFWPINIEPAQKCHSTCQKY